VELTARLKGNPANDNTRRLIIKTASGLKPAPAIPEEARMHFVEGMAIVKAAKNPAQQSLAAQSFTEALKVAPWWGDAYYNLGVAQELAEQYDVAEQAFNFYLLSNPGATEKREVQDRIYALSAKRKLLGAK
jgi:TolA-binding protein